MAGPEAPVKTGRSEAPLLWLAAALGAANLIIIVGGAFSPQLDALAGAAPGLLALGLLICAGAAVVRSRRLAAASALAMISLLLVMGVDLFAALRWPVDRQAAAIKIVSINVFTYNWTPGAIEDFVRNERPDIVLLQEAAGYSGRQLAERLAPLYPTQVANYPHCSTRIFSTFPVLERRPSETCSITAAVLQLPDALGGGDVLVASVHAPRNLEPREQRPAPALRMLIRQRGGASAIFGGDFNATPWSWSLRRLDWIEGIGRRTHALPTWPTGRIVPWRFRRFQRFVAPILPIDHVYASSDWATLDVRRGPNVGSDHYPVIVELARRPVPLVGVKQRSGERL